MKKSFSEVMAARRQQEKEVINFIKNGCVFLIAIEIYTLAIYFVISPIIHGSFSLGGEWILGIVILAIFIPAINKKE